MTSPNPVSESEREPQSRRARLTAIRLGISRSVTPLGWFVVGATVIAAGLALGMGLVEFGVIAIAGVLLLLIAIPYLIGPARGEVRFELAKSRVTVGMDAQLDVTVTNQSARPLLPSVVEVRLGEEVLAVRVPLIAPRGSVTTSAVIPTPQRAVIEVGPATAVRQDPLGMFRRARTDARVQQLFVHPPIVRVPNMSFGMIRDLDGNATANIVDSDIAFHAIRPYASGDARRHIHWKSTAKTGALMVKQFEETKRSRLSILVATERSEYASVDEFELAVSVAASLGSQAIAEGRETDVLVSPDVVHSGAEDRRVRGLNTTTRRAFLDQLSGLELHDEAVAIEHLGARAAVGRQNASLVAVVSGTPTTYRQLRATALPFGPDVQFIAITCDPATEPGVRIVGEFTLLQIGLLTDLQQLLLRGVLS